MMKPGHCESDTWQDKLKLVLHNREYTDLEKLVRALVFDSNIVVWRTQVYSLDRLGLFGTAELDGPWLC